MYDRSHHKQKGAVVIKGKELPWEQSRQALVKWYSYPAGGHLPSAEFGANAAWSGIMVLAFNLNSLMKRLALPKEWAPKRLKAIRFGFINLAGRVVSRARQLIIRLSASHPGYGLLLEARRRIQYLWEHNDMAVASRSP